MPEPTGTSIPSVLQDFAKSFNTSFWFNGSVVSPNYSMLTGLQLPAMDPVCPREASSQYGSTRDYLSCWSLIAATIITQPQPVQRPKSQVPQYGTHSFAAYIQPLYNNMEIPPEMSNLCDFGSPASIHIETCGRLNLANLIQRRPWISKSSYSILDNLRRISTASKRNSWQNPISCHTSQPRIGIGTKDFFYLVAN